MREIMACMDMNHVAILLFSVMPWVSALATAGKVPAIIVFGDSTVDSGNNNQINTLLKSNFPPYGRDFMGGRPTGRFSNGRLGTDFYSEAFGLRPFVPAYLDPNYGIEDFAGGVCFASAGTGLDVVTSDVLSVLPLSKEVENYKEYQSRLRSYLGEGKANRILREALYVISIGTNDFIENYYTPLTDRAKQFTVDEYVNQLIRYAWDFLSELYYLGARKIAFTGLSAMGCIPLQRTSNLMNFGSCNEEQNMVAKDFNMKLQFIVEKLNSALPRMQLTYLPLYDLFLDVIEQPSKYGFENAELGCCATGKFELSYLCNQWNPWTCTDASKYAFWDAVHPTERMSHLVASYLVNTTLVQYM